MMHHQRRSITKLNGSLTHTKETVNLAPWHLAPWQLKTTTREPFETVPEGRDTKARFPFIPHPSSLTPSISEFPIEV